MDDPIALISARNNPWLSKMTVLLATARPPIPFRWCLDLSEAPRNTLKLSAEPLEGTLVIDPERPGSLTKVREAYRALSAPLVVHQQPAPKEPPSSARSPAVIPVLASGGAGASTTAMALSQVLALKDATVLIDLTLGAHLGLYHDLPAESLDTFHLAGLQGPAQALNTPVKIATRGYHLLAASGQITRWSSLSSCRVNELIASLGRDYDSCVIDLEPRFLGGKASGNLDWEELGAVPRTILDGSQAAVMVARNTLKGAFDGVNLAREILSSAKNLKVLAVVVVSQDTRGRRNGSSSLKDLVRRVLPAREAPRLHFVDLGWADLEVVHREVKPFPGAMLKALSPLAELTRESRYHPRNPAPRPLTAQLNLLAESLNLFDPQTAPGGYLAR